MLHSDLKIGMKVSRKSDCIVYGNGIASSGKVVTVREIGLRSFSINEDSVGLKWHAEHFEEYITAENELSKLESQYAEIGEKIRKLKESTFRPTLNDEYYTVNSNGSIEWHKFRDSSLDNEMYSIGNVFRTREEAESQVKSMMVLAELRQCEGHKKFVIGGSNVSIYIDFRDGICKGITYQNTDGGWHSIYFSNAELMDAAVSKITKGRIIKAARWFSMREVWVD